MAHKQLPGFGVELPEITFDGVSFVLILNPELWQIQHYIIIVL
jgi:hypothetical protein